MPLSCRDDSHYLPFTSMASLSLKNTNADQCPHNEQHQSPAQTVYSHIHFTTFWLALITKSIQNFHCTILALKNICLWHNEWHTSRSSQHTCPYSFAVRSRTPGLFSPSLITKATHTFHPRHIVNLNTQTEQFTHDTLVYFLKMSLSSGLEHIITFTFTYSLFRDLNKGLCLRLLVTANKQQLGLVYLIGFPHLFLNTRQNPLSNYSLFPLCHYITKQYFMTHNLDPCTQKWKQR